MSIFSSPGSSDSLMVLWAAAALDVGTFDYHPHFMRSLAFECVHVFNLSLKKKIKNRIPVSDTSLNTALPSLLTQCVFLRDQCASDIHTAYKPKTSEKNTF